MAAIVGAMVGITARSRGETRIVGSANNGSVTRTAGSSETTVGATHYTARPNEEVRGALTAIETAAVTPGSVTSENGGVATPGQTAMTTIEGGGEGDTRIERGP